MTCPYAQICGGCLQRGQELKSYQEAKEMVFRKILGNINQDNLNFGASVFVPDNTRRRASMAFHHRKGKITLGFNEAKSNNLIDCETCALLTPKLNANLPHIRRLLTEICAIPVVENKGKGKKANITYISDGDIWLCDADNGIDVVLEFDKKLELGHRMAIFELSQTFEEIIRVSHRCKVEDEAEAIVEKIKPYIKIANTFVYVPAGTFLQPSKEGEQALVDLVLKYLGDTTGKIADLFCGVGTFSYPLAQNINNKIIAVDSSPRLLDGFRQTVNKNMIPNIEIVTKNLFKYPLDEKELKGIEAVVFDPPRAGASAQIKKISEMSAGEQPKKIIAVSCNPHSFISDANLLLAAGYHLDEVTMVDQFIYSNHSELVALFTK